MHSTPHLVWNLIPLFVVLGFMGWLLWRWLKASDEPGQLLVRWAISAVVLGFVFVSAARARDEFSKIAAVLIGAVGGLVMTFVWRQKFCDFVGDQFASLYTGGNEQVDPTPFYSRANARRKQGRYAEAIEEVQSQLERFPTDFPGWMLLAEIQAEDLKDLSAARETLAQVLAQEGHAPKNIAFALSREADWHLKLNGDRESARLALEQIVARLPGTEQAQLALQRIAHLTPEAMLAEREAPARIALRPGEQNIGLRTTPVNLVPPPEDPSVVAGKFVQHLEQYPDDYEAREKLALLYAREYQRLDLATDQLEQLIGYPGQPTKQVVHWLNTLADLQIELTGDEAQARATLRRIAELYPKTAAAENALNRIAYLKLELRPKRAAQVVKLGSYEQNIGLKHGPPGGSPSESDAGING